MDQSEVSADPAGCDIIAVNGNCCTKWINQSEVSSDPVGCMDQSEVLIPQGATLMRLMVITALSEWIGFD